MIKKPIQKGTARRAQKAKKALCGILTAALCVSGLLPGAGTAMAEDIAAQSTDLMHYIPDNGVYPDSLKYYVFDTTSPDFSYTLSDEVSVVTEEPSWDGTYTQLAWGLQTTVQSEGAFSIAHPLSLKQKKICQIGTEWVDLTINIKNIAIGPHQGGETWAPSGHDGKTGRAYQVGDTITLCGIQYAGTNANCFCFYSSYNAKVTFDWEVRMTWNGTDTLVDVPFELIAGDIDVGSSDRYYTESWTLNDEEYSRYDIYEDNVLAISHPTSTTTMFSAPGDEVDRQTPQERYALTGLVAITKKGSLSGSTVCGGTTGSYLTFWSDYVLPGDPPVEKTIENAKEVYNAGDTVSFSITATMPEYMVDTYSTYTSIAMIDEIPDGLTYVEDSAKMYSGDLDVTSSAGTLSYDGNNTVRFDFSDAWVGDTANYAGQELAMTLDCTVDTGYNGERLENTGGLEIDNREYFDTVEVPIAAPALAITKSAVDTRFSVGDTVTYEIAVNQTAPGAIAQNTVVTDTLPDELELVSVETDTGSATIDGNGFCATLGALSTDAANLTVTAKALTDGEEIVNTAYATADDVDPVHDDAEIAVRRPVLGITKTADAEAYDVGDTVTYTITVTNVKEEASGEEAEGASEEETEGASEEETDRDLIPTAYNVVVRDTLPGELTLLEVTASDGTETTDGTVTTDGNSFTVTYPFMYCGDEHTITVTAEVLDVEATTATNVAYVSSDSTEEISDDAEIRINETPIVIEPEPDKPEPDEPEPDVPEPDDPAPSDPAPTYTVKTGEDKMPIVYSAIGGAAALSAILLLIRRRRRS